jgi:hypothetical protein
MEGVRSKRIFSFDPQEQKHIDSLPQSIVSPTVSSVIIRVQLKSSDGGQELGPLLTGTVVLRGLTLNIPPDIIEWPADDGKRPAGKRASYSLSLSRRFRERIWWGGGAPAILPF